MTESARKSLIRQKELYLLFGKAMRPQEVGEFLTLSLPIRWGNPMP